jgi:hypothetical protein
MISTTAFYRLKAKLEQENGIAIALDNIDGVSLRIYF